MQIWYKLRDDEELMKKIALVHITGSKFGLRIVFVADINLGNLADNQIVLAEKLGQKPDESCIDATRNSFAPKEEDILYINEDLLFNYYNEEFDKRYTQLYREKKTQPLYHEFDTRGEKQEARGERLPQAQNKSLQNTAIRGRFSNGRKQINSDGSATEEPSPSGWGLRRMLTGASSSNASI